MENNIYKIKLGQWKKREIAEGRVIYQCSECGNVDDPTKTECPICKARMEVRNDSKRLAKGIE